MRLAPHAVDRGGVRIAFDAFDTANFIAVYGEHVDEGLLESLEGMCLRFNKLWDFTDSQSDIARINSAGEEPVHVAAETSELLRAGLALQKAEPCFNMLLGPVTGLWKGAASVPSQDDLEGALGHCGPDALRVASGGTVFKNDPLARVDVGAFAKGRIAAVLADLLRNCGITTADIDLGGNLYLMGLHPEGRPWRLSVDLPEDFPGEAPRFVVADASVSTTSNFLRAEEISGEVYGHILDPRTGRPAETDIVSATVVSRDALKADALSTAAFVAGTSQLPALAARHLDCGFIAVCESGQVVTANLPNTFARCV